MKNNTKKTTEDQPSFLEKTGLRIFNEKRNIEIAIKFFQQSVDFYLDLIEVMKRYGTFPKARRIEIVEKLDEIVEEYHKLKKNNPTSFIRQHLKFLKKNLGKGIGATTGKVKEKTSAIHDSYAEDYMVRIDGSYENFCQDFKRFLDEQSKTNKNYHVVAKNNELAHILHRSFINTDSKKLEVNTIESYLSNHKTDNY